MHTDLYIWRVGQNLLVWFPQACGLSGSENKWEAAERLGLVHGVQRGSECVVFSDSTQSIATFSFKYSITVYAIKKPNRNKTSIYTYK